MPKINQENGPHLGRVSPTESEIYSPSCVKPITSYPKPRNLDNIKRSLLMCGINPLVLAFKQDAQCILVSVGAKIKIASITFSAVG